MSKLTSKNVLIVGGSSGIGAAAAKAFIALGANVTVASRNQAKLDAAAVDIGPGVRTAVLDTTDDDAVTAFFANAGRFDHVVISAAQTSGGPVRQLMLAEAYAAMNSKFWGAYRVARAEDIAEDGSLTLVSGYLSVRPSKNSVLQGAINAALEALARGLALGVVARTCQRRVTRPDCHFAVVEDERTVTSGDVRGRRGASCRSSRRCRERHRLSGNDNLCYGLYRASRWRWCNCLKNRIKDERFTFAARVRSATAPYKF